MNYEKVGEKSFLFTRQLIFDTDYQRAQFNTEFGLLIKLNFTRDNYTWEAFGLRIDRECERLLERNSLGYLKM